MIDFISYKDCFPRPNRDTLSHPRGQATECPSGCEHDFSPLGAVTSVGERKLRLGKWLWQAAEKLDVQPPL